MVKNIMFDHLSVSWLCLLARFRNKRIVEKRQHPSDLNNNNNNYIHTLSGIQDYKTEVEI